MIDKNLKTCENVENTNLKVSMYYSISGEILGTIKINSKGEVFLLDANFESDEIASKMGEKCLYNEYPGNGPFSEEQVAYKLKINNIASVYFFETMQGGVSYDIVLIDKNKIANIISLYAVYYEKKISDVTYKEKYMENIISAMNLSTHNTKAYALIDINGNKIEIK